MSTVELIASHEQQLIDAELLLASLNEQWESACRAGDDVAALEGGHRENGTNRTISPAGSLQALTLCSRCPNGVRLNLASDRMTEVRQGRGYFGFS